MCASGRVTPSLTLAVKLSTGCPRGTVSRSSPNWFRTRSWMCCTRSMGKSTSPQHRSAERSEMSCTCTEVSVPAKHKVHSRWSTVNTRAFTPPYKPFRSVLRLWEYVQLLLYSVIDVMILNQSCHFLSQGESTSSTSSRLVKCKCHCVFWAVSCTICPWKLRARTVYYSNILEMCSWPSSFPTDSQCGLGPCWKQSEWHCEVW